jgi:hypothetical protein
MTLKPRIVGKRKKKEKKKKRQIAPGQQSLNRGPYPADIEKNVDQGGNRISDSAPGIVIWAS